MLQINKYRQFIQQQYDDSIIDTKEKLFNKLASLNMEFNADYPKVRIILNMFGQLEQIYNKFQATTGKHRKSLFKLAGQLNTQLIDNYLYYFDDVNIFYKQNFTPYLRVKHGFQIRSNNEQLTIQQMQYYQTLFSIVLSRIVKDIKQTMQQFDNVIEDEIEETENEQN